MKHSYPVFFFLLLVLTFSCRHPDKNRNAAAGPKKETSAASVQKLNAEDSLKILMQEVIHDTGFRHASISFYILDYTHGKPSVVTDLNSQISLVPASVLKVLTTGAALDILGVERSFRTSLQYDGTIDNGTLKGNLYIHGGGDPTFGSEDVFKRWIYALRQSGIDTIKGSVIGDASVFGKFTIPLTWTWGELQLPYCAPASGLTIYGNVFQLKGSQKKGKYHPGQDKMQPEVPGMYFENSYADTSETGTEGYITGDPYSNTFYATGGRQLNPTLFPYSGVIPDPPLIAAAEFRNRLISEGFFVSGDAVDLFNADSITKATIRKERKELAYTYSPSVATLVNLTNLYSNNLFAEHLVKLIGLYKYHNGSTESGCKAVLEYWKSRNIDTEGMFLYDGCGISRYNGVTARQLADVLFEMTHSPSFQIFYNSLPLAGVSGTLTRAMKGTSAEGNIRAKTGTMSRVKSYAGYARTTTGKRLIFIMMVNNYTCSHDFLKEKLERIMVAMTKL